MARYLLIEFDDNDSAERMKQKIDEAEAAGKRFRVVGMYTHATQLCECPVPTGDTVRGAKFKWWLCPECKKPKNRGGQDLYNMLDDWGTDQLRYLSSHIHVNWVKHPDGIRTLTSKNQPVVWPELRQNKE